jgi:ATP-dependent Clp protease ATP-binding subunit ClpA
VLAGTVGPCHSWDLFERFTEAARQVVVCAQQEARDLKHGHIGTEHELLGLLWVNDGPTADVLGSLGITLQHARDQVVRIVGPGERVAPDQIPFTPRAKKVLELSLREALALGHNHIGPEHLLLGLLTDNGGTANRILDEAGADPESIRSQLLPLLPGPDPEVAQPPMAKMTPITTGVAAQSERGVTFRVTPTVDAHHLLMAAAGHALEAGRTEFAISDLLLALTRSDETAGLLADLGINEQTMREAIRKHRT